MLRYVNKTFSDNQKCTIQATYLQKDVKLPDRTVTLSIWDTAGQERYHALGPIYYRNADGEKYLFSYHNTVIIGALLVYDCTDHDTFERAKNWVKELRKVVGEDIVLTIAGNKMDLKNKQVKEEEVAEYAKSVNATHISTSAKVNKNVDEAFMDLTRRILESKQQKLQERNIGKRQSQMPTSNGDFG